MYLCHTEDVSQAAVVAFLKLGNWCSVSVAFGSFILILSVRGAGGLSQLLFYLDKFKSGFVNPT